MNKQKLARMFLEEYKRYVNKRLDIDESTKRILDEAVKLAQLIQKEKHSDYKS